MEEENKKEVNLQHGSTKLMLGEVITNMFVEINENEVIPVRELPKDLYEKWLDMTHRIRMVYLTVENRK